MTVNDELNNQQNGPDAAPAPSLGQRLRVARQAAGLSQDEVAIQLRLRVELIRALEEDDHANLPPLAFVSGYVRSYARLLGLPAEELTSSLERRETAAVVKPVLPPQERRSGDWPVKVVTYLVAAALVALLAVWWYTRQPVEQDTFTELAPQAGPGDAVELILPPADDEPLEADTAAEETATQEEADAAAASAVTVEEPALPAITEVRLEAATGDCWVSIKDATGMQLIYELVPHGASRTVRGTAPFSVFLGYAPAMKVYYQGREFDHSAYLRGDVARFRLGSIADNKPVTQ